MKEEIEKYYNDLAKDYDIQWFVKNYAAILPRLYSICNAG